MEYLEVWQYTLSLQHMESYREEKYLGSPPGSGVLAKEPQEMWARILPVKFFISIHFCLGGLNLKQYLVLRVLKNAKTLEGPLSAPRFTKKSLFSDSESKGPPRTSTWQRKERTGRLEHWPKPGRVRGARSTRRLGRNKSLRLEEPLPGTHWT